MPPPPSRPAATDPGPRLESWKAIAAQLNRDVRTVQRWHRRAGLPVHRHADPKQRGVFAFAGELDAWANQVRLRDGEQGPSLAWPERVVPGAVTSAVEPPPTPPGRGAVPLLAAVLMSVVGILAAVAFRAHNGASAKPRPAASRDVVVVAALVNNSGDRTLDSALQFTLERELSAGPLQLLAPARVHDVLRLMRQPTNAVLIPSLAREIAQRAGDVKVVAAGRVDRVGQLYQFTLELIEPRTGVALSTRIDRVSSPAKLLTSMGALAVWATRALQNVPPQGPVETLPQVTTPSLAALRLYGRALDALQRNHRQEARVLLTSALNDDPEFASAHSRLSVVLRNETPLDSWRPHDARAVALSTALPDLERLRIMGQHYMMTGDGDGAIASLEAVSRIDPADAEALTSLSGLYYRQRRMTEAVDARVRVSRLRPNDWVVAASTAQAFLLWTGNVDSARVYVQRANELRAKDSAGFSSEVGRANLPPGHARFASWLLYFHAYELWRAGDVRGAIAEVRRVLNSDPLPTPADRDALVTVAISFYQSAGRLDDARTLAGAISQERLRHHHLGVIADLIDDFASLRAEMRQVPVAGEQRGLRYVRAGLFSAAEAAISRDLSRQGFAETARGELAVRRGNTHRAIDQLQRGIDLARAHGYAERYLAAESLADIFVRAGRPQDAVRTLESAVGDAPLFSMNGLTGGFWLRTLERLARLYAALGRTGDADAVDRRLRDVLVVADTDHPLVRYLSRAPTAAAASNAPRLSSTSQGIRR